MWWVLDFTTSPAFNFTFTYFTFVWFTLIGIIAAVKVIKEAFRR